MKRIAESDDFRFQLYRIGAHVAWWGAFAWTVALTTVNLGRGELAPRTAFQTSSPIVIILLIGIAIALGNALSRMRLAKTIAEVFNLGLTLSAQRELAELDKGKTE